VVATGKEVAVAGGGVLVGKSGKAVGGTDVAVGGTSVGVVALGKESDVAEAETPLLTDVAVGSSLEQAASRVEMMSMMVTARKSLDILFPRIFLVSEILDSGQQSLWRVGFADKSIGPRRYQVSRVNVWLSAEGKVRASFAQVQHQVGQVCARQH